MEGLDAGEAVSKFWSSATGMLIAYLLLNLVVVSKDSLATCCNGHCYFPTKPCVPAAPLQQTHVRSRVSDKNLNKTDLGAGPQVRHPHRKLRTSLLMVGGHTNRLRFSVN